MEIIDEKSAQIVLNNADPDDFMLSGTIEIENGESLEITPEIKDGSKAAGLLFGFNLTLILGLIIMIVFWKLLFDGVRL